MRERRSLAPRSEEVASGDASSMGLLMPKAKGGDAKKETHGDAIDLGVWESIGDGDGFAELGNAVAAYVRQWLRVEVEGFDSPEEGELDGGDGKVEAVLGHDGAAPPRHLQDAEAEGFCSICDGELVRGAVLFSGYRGGGSGCGGDGCYCAGWTAIQLSAALQLFAELVLGCDVVACG